MRWFYALYVRRKDGTSERVMIRCELPSEVLFDVYAGEAVGSD
jgi:hypothetical protein